MLQTQLIETEYGQVRFAERPSTVDAAPLVFVHGYPDNLQIWSRVFREFEPGRRLIAFDWPGLGHSAPFAGGGTPFHLGRQFIAVLDALGIEQAVPVGFDMGSHAVVAAASRAPERIERLILTNYLADGSVETSWDISVMRKLGLNRLVLRFAARIVFERAQQTFLEDCALSPGVRADFWASFRRPEVRAHLRRMCVGYQGALQRVTKLYPEIATRVLVLWADSDPHFPLAQGRAVADALASSSLQILSDAPHWFMWDQPGETASRIADYLRSGD